MLNTALMQYDSGAIKRHTLEIAAEVQYHAAILAGDGLIVQSQIAYRWMFGQ
jgi:hypothetical protein